MCAAWEKISQIDVIERAAFSNAWKKPSELITMRAFVSLVCGHVGKVHPSLVLGKMENMCMCVQVYFIYFLGNNNSECKIICVMRRRRFHHHSISHISWLAFLNLLYLISHGETRLSCVYVFTVSPVPWAGLGKGAKNTQIIYITIYNKKNDSFK